MSVMSLPRSLWTPFQEKTYELDLIKQRAYKLMAEFNDIVLEYRDWFNRRHKTFLLVIKSVQIAAPCIVPYDVTTLADLRKLTRIGEGLTRTGFQFRGQEHVTRFLAFWEELCKLKEYFDNDLMLEVIAFCASVERLREPKLKQEIDDMHAELCEKCSETFNFAKIHNERVNLFVYKLSFTDQRFIDLVGFFPHLLDIATKMLFTIGRLYIERL